jgi:hypothetical protein
MMSELLPPLDDCEKQHLTNIISISRGLDVDTWIGNDDLSIRISKFVVRRFDALGYSELSIWLGERHTEMKEMTLLTFGEMNLAVNDPKISPHFPPWLRVSPKRQDRRFQASRQDTWGTVARKIMTSKMIRIKNHQPSSNRSTCRRRSGKEYRGSTRYEDGVR